MSFSGFGVRARKSVTAVRSRGPNEGREIRHRIFERMRTRRSVALLAVFFVISGFYFWTGTSSANPVHIGGPQVDFYNQLGDGFVHGHLYIPTPAPKSLLDLPNPYAPPCCDLTTWDTALYKGHLYLEYGATPVLVFYLPWRLLQLGDIPENLAVIFMAMAALAGALCCLDFLVGRYKPMTRTWKLVFAAMMLGLGLGMPFMLRSPSIYEASVAGGVCFTTWALFWLGSGALAERPVRWRLALGSLGVGLAFGAHADLLVLAIVLIAALVYLLRRSRGASRSDLVRLGAALLGPFLAVAFLLALYNHARFGSFTQTGERYDIGCNCVNAPQFRPAALLEGGYQYFLAPIRFTLSFPYFNLPPPPQYFWTPLSNNIVEPVGGILAIAPITLGLFATPFLLRRRHTRELGGVVAILVVAGVLIAAGVSSVGTVAVRYTQRLEADFAFLLLLPAVVLWLIVGGRRWYRRLATGVGAAFIVFGSIVGVASSMTGYYNNLDVSAPTTFRNLQSATSAFPTLVTWLLGRPYISSVVSPAGDSVAVNNFTTIGVGDGLAFSLSPASTEIDIVSPTSRTVNFAATFTRGLDAPPRGRIVIAAQYGSIRFEQRFIPGEHLVTLHLSQGLNRIEMTAQPVRGAVSGAREVGLSGISLVPVKAS